MDIMIITNNYY